MASPASIAGQIGFKTEATYGTDPTVDEFHPGLLDESVQQQIERINSRGIRAGRRVNHAWVAGAKTIAGAINVELWDEPAVTLLEHMLGTVSTTGAGPYTHTATPGDLSTKSFTVEFGRPDDGGTVQPFQYTGCKIGSWDLSCAVGEIPTLSLDITAQSETTGGSLASASYPTAAPFVFTQASLSAASSEITTVRSVNLSADNNLASDRHKLNSDEINQQRENGMRTYSGTIEADFEDLTEYNRFVNGDEFALEYKFDNATDSLTITMNVRYDGQTPTLTNDGRLTQTLPYFVTSGTSDADGITAVLTNNESNA